MRHIHRQELKNTPVRKLFTLPIASTFFFPFGSGNFPNSLPLHQGPELKPFPSPTVPTRSNSYPLWRVRPRPRTAGLIRPGPLLKAARAGRLTPLAPLPLRARLRADLLGQVLQIGILGQERGHVGNQCWDGNRRFPRPTPTGSSVYTGTTSRGAGPRRKYLVRRRPPANAISREYRKPPPKHLSKSKLRISKPTSQPAPEATVSAAASFSELD